MPAKTAISPKIGEIAVFAKITTKSNDRGGRRMPAEPAISEGKWVIIRYLHYCATYKMICCQNSFVKTSQTRLATIFDLVLFKFVIFVGNMMVFPHLFISMAF